MSEISETEIKAMTKEQNYMRGYKDGKSDVLNKIRAEIEETYRNITYQENKDRKATWGLRTALNIIDKYKAESEKKEEIDPLDFLKPLRNKNIEEFTQEERESVANSLDCLKCELMGYEPNYKIDALTIAKKFIAKEKMKEEISKDNAIKIVHDTIHDFFDDSETFNDKEKLLLKINKAICNNIMGY